MKLNGRGAMGEMVFMMFRLVLIAVIAFVILGISSTYYSHYIDVRDAEAEIMATNVVECLSPEGVIYPDNFVDGKENSFLIVCGYGSGELDRFYIRARVFSEEGSEILELSQGEAGMTWVKDIFDKHLEGEGIKKYEPGYYKEDYKIHFYAQSGLEEGKLEVEVFVNNEF